MIDLSEVKHLGSEEADRVWGAHGWIELPCGELRKQHIRREKGQFPINSTGRWYLVTFRRLKSERSDGLLPGWRPEWRKDSGKWGGAPFRNQAVLLGAPIGFHYFFDLVFDRLKLPMN